MCETMLCLSDTEIYCILTAVLFVVLLIIFILFVIIHLLTKTASTTSKLNLAAAEPLQVQIVEPLIELVLPVDLEGVLNLAMARITTKHGGPLRRLRHQARLRQTPLLKA